MPRTQSYLSNLRDAHAVDWFSLELHQVSSDGALLVGGANSLLFDSVADLTRVALQRRIRIPFLGQDTTHSALSAVKSWIAFVIAPLSVHVLGTVTAGTMWWATCSAAAQEVGPRP